MSSFTSSKVLKSSEGDKNLDGRKSKVAVVTGSNQGLGYGIVKALCEKFEGDVYLTAPTERQGLPAIQSLNELGYRPKFFLLDVTSREHAEKLRDHLVEHYGGLDILVNNAGTVVQYLGHMESFELKMREILRINYYGFRDTCNILFPILKPHARVVTICSSMGHLKEIPGEHLRKIFASPDVTQEQVNGLVEDYTKTLVNKTYAEEGWPRTGCAYRVSKVAVAALSRIQQREVLKDKDRPDIIVNFIHPGPVDTDMEKDKKYPSKLTIDQAAETPVWLALLPENCTKPKGDFVWFRREIVDWINGPLPPYWPDTGTK